MSLSVKEILNIAQRQLEQAGVEDALIDSKTLYCYLMKLDNAQLILEYQKVLPDSLCDEYFALLDRRCSGVPTQYITGVQAFMGFEFSVDESVLIPRQDTETMVEDAISIIKENKLRGEDLPIKAKKNYDVLDLCCGSGAIGISLDLLCENVKVICSDVSSEAIAVAKENSHKLGCASKIQFECGNLFAPFRGKIKKKKFDMIISNPPYIKSSVIGTLQREVREHEPLKALDGGVDGLDFYKKIVDEASDFLKKEGVLLLEIGHDQKGEVTELLQANERFENITCLKDLAGRDRIVCATLGPKKK